MALDCFSKVFDLEESKGFFPLKFNKPKNWNFIGKLPALK